MTIVALMAFALIVCAVSPSVTEEQYLQELAAKMAAETKKQEILYYENLKILGIEAKPKRNMNFQITEL